MLRIRTTKSNCHPAVAEGVESYWQRASAVARMDSAEGAALSPRLLAEHAARNGGGGGGASGSAGGRPATITRGELAALALRKVRHTQSRGTEDTLQPPDSFEPARRYACDCATPAAVALLAASLCLDIMS